MGAHRWKIYEMAGIQEWQEARVEFLGDHDLLPGLFGRIAWWCQRDYSILQRI
jgi:hypothetical protein